MNIKVLLMTMALALSATAGWADEVEHAADGGGLAGTVGPEEAEDLAALHLQIDPTQGAELSVGLLEIADLDGGGVRHRGSFGLSFEM